MPVVPFFANTADNTHCVQAAFAMMLKTFIPERTFSYEQLDKLTKKSPGKGTWWFPVVAEFKKLGLRVKIIEHFDYQKFYELGEEYLFKAYSSEIANWYLSNSNLVDVKGLIPEFMKNADIEKRPATITDLDKLLDSGWLVALEINSCVLNGLAGFNAHMVVVFRHAQNVYQLHDPGLPPLQNCKVSQADLLRAWQYGGNEKAALVALKRPHND